MVVLVGFVHGLERAHVPLQAPKEVALTWVEPRIFKKLSDFMLEGAFPTGAVKKLDHRNNADQWLAALLPILDRPLHAYEGNVGSTFWNAIIKRGGFYGNYFPAAGYTGHMEKMITTIGLFSPLGLVRLIRGRQLRRARINHSTSARARQYEEPCRRIAPA